MCNLAMVPSKVAFCLFVNTAWQQVRWCSFQFEKVDQVCEDLHLHTVEKTKFLSFVIVVVGSPRQTAWKPAKFVGHESSVWITNWTDMIISLTYLTGNWFFITISWSSSLVVFHIWVAFRILFRSDPSLPQLTTTPVMPFYSTIRASNSWSCFLLFLGGLPTFFS